MNLIAWEKRSLHGLAVICGVGNNALRFMSILFFCAGIVFPSFAGAQDKAQAIFDEMDREGPDFDARMDAFDRQFQDQTEWMEKQWNNAAKNQKEMWIRFEAEVKQKWQQFTRSTRTTWVDYSRDKDTRSQVDFKKGQIIIETIVQDDDPGALRKVRQNIQKKLKELVIKEDIAGITVLEKQIKDQNGRSVHPGNVETFLKKEVLPRIKADPHPVLSRDGVLRRRYRTKINMVPKHLRIRAKKYLPLVIANAKRFHLKPQLVLAVMHTESYFNPLAVSHSNALGIMQIIPRHAGRDAYQYIYGEDRVITPQYLFLPDHNIELGSAYLSLLRYQYFPDVSGDLKNRYVAVCGYNWGPTAMRKNIVDVYPLTQMSDTDVYALLKEKTPRETRTYIQRVVERMPLYDAWFSF